MHELKSKYMIDSYDSELVYLDGIYSNEIITNKLLYDENTDIYKIDENPLLHAKSKYLIGNVLYRINTENIDELIEIIIRYTYDKCTDLNFDYSVYNKITMVGGTICPTKETCFKYKNKIFILYGRYIFGYDKDHVIFKNITSKNKNIILSCYDEEKHGYNFKEYTSDHNFAFSIIDSETGIMDAFGLYR
ncbi:unknown similar to AcMNPV orf7 [Choristoneura rosaceana entomopoxvirus 'L']|uniref:Uncharacterized protein n=1 Tax=Choristoneura rosaceana entomopoxvirus 'L' TaxID=1293539 RepID=A0ABM9QL31_9POXV|nr:unknown similar to AcMNPV orf7 [Choristoneura rosaceana entomopoxvirus 'L']YP_008004698.1 unknown similar to AcMNPV orf7 [Choristoneura rosaceana entomopoxvirus 'L']CCU55905.1 unknown similar to AcMNPV orf7 [Choristoneura rosaceana entomopoxvirus 'L']CCU56196.1 unknown similar to AcMNPV orf7 [Choristoneura rosaceana entomopoxvirus 'L']